jgi:hypothetical protein
MWCALLGLAWGSNVTFPGGDDLDLVAFLGQHTGLMVVKMLDGFHTWKPITFQTQQGRISLAEVIEAGKLRWTIRPHNGGFVIDQPSFTLDHFGFDRRGPKRY